MAIDPSIFGLRYRSNAKLLPTGAELDQFLESPEKTGSRVPRVRDLERYHGLIEQVNAFSGKHCSDEDAPDFRDLMLFGVIGRTQFVSPGLELAVWQFKYHLHQLNSLDFHKPEAFIQAAEQEIADLDPTRREHTARKARLRFMIGERKQMIAVLTKRRAELFEELGSIAQYIRENLVRIERVCEASIVILVGIEVTKSTKKEVIAVLKEQFRDRLADARLRGPIPRQELEKAKRDFAALSRAVAVCIRDDIYTLTALYEDIYEHVQRGAGAIEGLLARNKAGQGGLALWKELDGVLDALVQDFRFELKAVAMPIGTSYEDVLREKRREVLDHFLTLLDRDRRERKERRTHGEKRKYPAPTSQASERRARKERRLASRRCG